MAVPCQLTLGDTNSRLMVLDFPACHLPAHNMRAAAESSATGGSARACRSASCLQPLASCNACETAVSAATL